MRLIFFSSASHAFQRFVCCSNRSHLYSPAFNACVSCLPSRDNCISIRFNPEPRRVIDVLRIGLARGCAARWWWRGRKKRPRVIARISRIGETGSTGDPVAVNNRADAHPASEITVVIFRGGLWQTTKERRREIMNHNFCEYTTTKKPRRKSRAKNE